MPSSTTEKNGCLKVDGSIKPTNSLNVKKSLSLFSTFRGFTKKSHKQDASKSGYNSKDKDGISKVVSYIFKRTNSMTSANRKRAKERMSNKMSYRRKDKAIVDKLTPKKSLRRCNLKDVIESPIYLPLFHGYLKSEFSEENLDFLMSVKEFRQFPNNEKAAEIYELFVRINSLKEINIEFGVRKKIEQKKDSADKKIFDEAYDKVFKLVESDSFSRFKQTMFEV